MNAADRIALPAGEAEALAEMAEALDTLEVPAVQIEAALVLAWKKGWCAGGTAAVRGTLDEARNSGDGSCRP